MSPSSTEETNLDDSHSTSLGEYLRETRIKLELELETISEETRIPPKSLRAIEDDDFSALPAEAFSRGFYTLYAKALSLDPEDILKKYAQVRGISPASEQPLTQHPYSHARQVGNMAERPAGMPFSFFGLVLFFLLAFGALICWYFSWNPATFLSEKLRSFQPTHTEILETSNTPASHQPLFEVTQVKKNPTNGSEPLSFSSLTSTTAAIAQPLTETGRYIVHAKFIETTEITLIIDDLPQRSLTFQQGDSTIWNASKQLTITLPAKTLTRLTLNNIPLEIPQTNDPTVTLKIPEFLLQ